MEYIKAGVKRLFDIFASGVALIVLSPIWLIALIGIELADPGPAFYMADRVGKDNQKFHVNTSQPLKKSLVFA